VEKGGIHLQNLLIGLNIINKLALKDMNNQDLFHNGNCILTDNTLVIIGSWHLDKGNHS